MWRQFEDQLISQTVAPYSLSARRRGIKEKQGEDAKKKREMKRREGMESCLTPTLSLSLLPPTPSEKRKKEIGGKNRLIQFEKRFASSVEQVGGGNLENWIYDLATSPIQGLCVFFARERERK